MNRRDWLRLVPGLPALGTVGTGQMTYVETTRRLANGAVLHTRKLYEVCLNGAQRLVEDVDWISRNNETVSTTWKLWRT